MNKHGRYWLVHGNGPCNAKHASYESDKAEAKRLARYNSGETFVVLEAVKAFRKIDVEEMDVDGPSSSGLIDDGIPS